MVNVLSNGIKIPQSNLFLMLIKINKPETMFNFFLSNKTIKSSNELHLI